MACVCCKFCHRQTTNPTFCSRSCAAKYNNQISPKRKRTSKCVSCQTPILSGWKYCGICYKPSVHKKPHTMTIGDYRNQLSVKGKHPSWKSVHIRNAAKTLNKHKKKICQNCGYDKHVEHAHIRAISSFPDSATISEVSGPHNVVILCRNCHWEYDHGMIEIL